MMPSGCCCCSTTRHGVTVGDKAIFIILIVIVLSTQNIALEDASDSANGDDGMTPGSAPTPYLLTTWLATYNAMTTETVSNDCGKQYASHFLKQFLEANEKLQEICSSLETSISVSSVARVRLLVSKVRLDTFLDIRGSERPDILQCLNRLNSSLQDISSIADVGIIPGDTRYNCSNVTMATNNLEWTKCEWHCPVTGYAYYGSETCHANSATVTWNCSITCEEAFTTCFHGLSARGDLCKLINSSLNCLRSRRQEDPAHYLWCWQKKIDSIILGKISEARNHPCEVDDSDIDPMENACTTSSSSVATPTVTEKSTSTPIPTEGSTAQPLDWSMKVLKIDDTDVPSEGPYMIELEEGGPEKNITVLVSFHNNVCEMKDPCEIFVDVQFSDRREPRCRGTSNAISQVVIGNPWIDGSPVPEYETFCQIKVAEKKEIKFDTTDESTMIVTIPLKARVDNKYDRLQIRNMTLSFRRQTGIKKEKVFMESTKVEMKVKVKDRDTIATCVSINDPHLTTFDGLRYDNFYHGEFILYKHLRLPFQVNAVYQACSGDVKASCNCAIAVMSGDDVFVFDRCDKLKPKFNGLGGTSNITIYKTLLYQNANLTSATSLHDKGEGKKYILYLPTGTYVKILVNGELLNVWIVASTNDIGWTEGLCGTYDSNKTNDLRMRTNVVVPMDDVNGFSLSWRVVPYGPESLLRGVPPSSVPFEPKRYCRCSMDNNECKVALDVETCDIYEGEDVTGIFEETSIDPQLELRSSSRRKRETGSVITVDQPIVVDPGFVPPEYDWDSDEERTQAMQFCNMYIKHNTVGQLCRMVPGVDFQVQVDTCMADIKITKSRSWADSANDAMKESCLEQIKKNGSISDDLANQITGAICLQDCTGRGRCVDGQCECDPGYGSLDCSIPLDTPPNIAELPQYGLCDRSISDCDRVIVYGENFLNTPELVCLLTDAIIYANNYSIGNTSKEDAEYINFNSVECPIPIIKPYLITVSNDNGETESQPLLFIPYDSSCRDCSTNNTGCQLKLESCYIQNNCYQKGQENSENSCLVCRPERDGVSWSQAKSCSDPLVSDLVVATVAAVVGSFVGLALGVLLYIVCCKNRKSEGDGIPMDARDSEPFSPTMQPIDDNRLHRNSHLVPCEYPENLESGRNDYRGYQDYGQGVENGVDDTTYF